MSHTFSAAKEDMLSRIPSLRIRKNYSKQNRNQAGSPPIGWVKCFAGYAVLVYPIVTFYISVE
jgi:hypothetical protein